MHYVELCLRCGHLDEQHSKTGFYKACLEEDCDCDDLTTLGLGHV